MTVLLAIIAITLVLIGASSSAIGIAIACTIVALVLDTRALIMNRKRNT